MSMGGDDGRENDVNGALLPRHSERVRRVGKGNAKTVSACGIAAVVTLAIVGVFSFS